MTDVHSTLIRSKNMSAIRGKNTKPELLVRKILHSQGFRFRLHVKDLPGNPDIVLPKFRTVIFVHGCFWHQHFDCKYAVMPKSNREFWQKKLENNIARDARNISNLTTLGWKTLVVWECEINSIKFPDNLRETIMDTLTCLKAQS